MNINVHAIETAVPGKGYAQDYIRSFMMEHVARSRFSRLAIQRIYSRSGIQRRHSTISEFGDPPEDGLFYDASTQQIRNPPTGDRNQRYQTEASALAVPMAERLVSESAFSRDEITHVVTASCTGFFASGLDWLLIRELGLSPQTESYHLGFMGCYAAFPALRLAQDIAAHSPDAVILIVCVELCSLHLQFTEEVDDLLSASLFADGAAAALVSAQPPRRVGPVLEIAALDSDRTPAGESEMTWAIGNHGFDMELTPEVPKYIEKYLPYTLARLQAAGYDGSNTDVWAVHPGGRAILDAVQRVAHLSEESLQASITTLRDYGNMSSATIWFVLKNVMAGMSKESVPIMMMAFGPGLTIETGRATARLHREGNT